MRMEITGKTAIMFILGDPIAHVVGTAVLNAHFIRAGQDVAASPLHVLPRDLAATVGVIRRLQNVIGFGVTIPHKIDIMPLLDHLTCNAKLVGAVNFVRRDPDGRLTGDNADGQGFVAGLGAYGVDVSNANVLQIGAGGAGRAIAFAVAASGARRLHIVNRTMTKAAELASAVQAAFPACEVTTLTPEIAAVDLVINATSLGMKASDPLPIDPAGLRPGMAVAEVIMRPEITALLREAAERGCTIVPGRAMLDHQIALAAAFLTADRLVEPQA
jgi:shikimate dehydrogenase